MKLNLKKRKQKEKIRKFIQYILYQIYTTYIRYKLDIISDISSLEFGMQFFLRQIYLFFFFKEDRNHR